MIKIIRTTATNADFQKMIPQLDKYLSVTDGDDHEFYNQFNKLDTIEHVVLAYKNDLAMSCGAIKELNEDTMEIKRMFTKEEARGNGLATMVLSELESWAKQLGYQRCRLETGINQPEAIALYLKNEYHVIPSYDQYKNMPLSKCFEKKLN